MHTLLIVDVQNDFCPGGNLAVPNGDEIIPTINELAGRFEHVIQTQDWHPAGHQSFASAHGGSQPFDTVEMSYGEQVLWPDHCIQGTAGADFHPGLATDRTELIIRKGFRPHIDSYSAFFENDQRTPTGLTGYLRERSFDTIFVAGLAADFCVKWSAVDGRKQGFSVFVIRDATRGLDSNGSLERAWKEMRDAGVSIIQLGEVPA